MAALILPGVLLFILLTLFLVVRVGIYYERKAWKNKKELLRFFRKGEELTFVVISQRIEAESAGRRVPPSDYALISLLEDLCKEGFLEKKEEKMKVAEMTVRPTFYTLKET